MGAGRRLSVLGLFGVFLGCGVGAPGDRPLEVFAAASLREVGEEIGRAFERESGVSVRFNFAGSNTLARQLAAAPAGDVFWSADREWMSYLEERGRIVAGSLREGIGNRLVVVGRPRTGRVASTATDLLGLDFEHFAVGEPDSVPAGRYARRWLERVATPSGTVWQRLGPRMAPTSDVRAALRLAVADDSVVAVVYVTDAARAPEVEVLLEAPELGVRYSFAEVERESVHPAAGPFLDFALGPTGIESFRRHGFQPEDGRSE